MTTRDYHTVALGLAKRKSQASVGASARLGSAIEPILQGLTLFEAVKLRQFLDAEEKRLQQAARDAADLEGSRHREPP